MISDMSDGGHLIPHGMSQSQNGEQSPKAMVDSSNVHISMNQSHSNVCKNEISEEVDVTMGQYANTVKIDEENDQVTGESINSSGRHYLSSNQHQNLMNVTSATLSSVDNYAQPTQHAHAQLESSNRSIGESSVLFGMYQ